MEEKGREAAIMFRVRRYSKHSGGSIRQPISMAVLPAPD